MPPAGRAPSGLNPETEHRAHLARAFPFRPILVVQLHEGLRRFDACSRVANSKMTKPPS
jgi:hypothetical protein